MIIILLFNASFALATNIKDSETQSTLSEELQETLDFASNLENIMVFDHLTRHTEWVNSLGWWDTTSWVVADGLSEAASAIGDFFSGRNYSTKRVNTYKKLIAKAIENIIQSDNQFDLEGLELHEYIGSVLKNGRAMDIANITSEVKGRISHLSKDDQERILSFLTKTIKSNHLYNGMKAYGEIVSHTSDIADIFEMLFRDYEMGFAIINTLSEFNSSNDRDYSAALQQVKLEYTNKATAAALHFSNEFYEMLVEESVEKGLRYGLEVFGGANYFLRSLIWDSALLITGTSDYVEGMSEITHLITVFSEAKHHFRQAFHAVYDGDHSPEALSKLRITFDYTYSCARLLYESMYHNDLYSIRDWMDLTYITDNISNLSMYNAILEHPPIKVTAKPTATPPPIIINVSENQDISDPGASNIQQVSSQLSLVTSEEFMNRFPEAIAAYNQRFHSSLPSLYFYTIKQDEIGVSCNDWPDGVIADFLLVYDAEGEHLVDDSWLTLYDVSDELNGYEDGSFLLSEYFPYVYIFASCFADGSSADERLMNVMGQMNIEQNYSKAEIISLDDGTAILNAPSYQGKVYSMCYSYGRLSIFENDSVQIEYPDESVPVSEVEKSGACSSYHPHIVDDAGIFNPIEHEEINALIDDFISETQIDFVILTTSNKHDQTQKSIADAFYDENNYGIGSSKSGILYYLDMYNYVQYISTTGSAILELTNNEIESLHASSYEHLKNGEYSLAVKELVKTMIKYIGNQDALKTVSKEISSAEKIEALANNVATYQRNGKWGTILSDGTIATEAQYVWCGICNCKHGESLGDDITLWAFDGERYWTLSSKTGKILEEHWGHGPMGGTSRSKTEYVRIEHLGLYSYVKEDLEESKEITCQYYEDATEPMNWNGRDYAWVKTDYGWKTLWFN